MVLSNLCQTMGSEQSTSAGAGQWPQRSVSTAADGRISQFRRGKSLAERSESSTEEHEDSPGNRPGNTSPGPSICSDSDLPYISYTVSRPIGGETGDQVSSIETLYIIGDDSIFFINLFQILLNSPTSSNFNEGGLSEVQFLACICSLVAAQVQIRTDTLQEA